MFDPAAFLPDDLLERIRARVPIHDRENTFPQQDLGELRAAGYLSILVPTEHGGAGLTLEQAAILQQQLATASAATALAINKHLVWTGVAKVLADRGVRAVGELTQTSLWLLTLSVVAHKILYGFCCLSHR